MSRLEQFKAIPSQLRLKEKADLYRLFVENPQQGVLKVAEIAEQQGLALTPQDVADLIREVDEQT